jgi:isopropylmalate/homocitrate/citramalate synthase
MTVSRDMRIVEVGPRDGLQNEARAVTVDDKLRLIDALGAAGLKTIEAGSFVSPRWVPQMADTEELFARLHRLSGVRYPALVPNLKGLQAARACGVTDIAVFGAASESFSQKNINCSIAESLDRFAPVVQQAQDANMRVRGYISCVLGCPYEGEVPHASVLRVATALIAMGCTEISLGDTIGVGTPLKARRLVEAVAREIPVHAIALHFHDTYGQALANILACLETGVTVIDSAVAGLGGCPYARGATGNVATEDVVYMLEGMGLPTGLDLDRLCSAGEGISAVLGRPTASRVARARARAAM